MTTPAVNVDSVKVTHDGHTLYRDPNLGPVENSAVAVTRAHTWSQRPASVSHPWENNKKYTWREPGAWSHSGGNLVLGSGEAVLTTELGQYQSASNGAAGAGLCSPYLNPIPVPSISGGLVSRAEVAALNKLKAQKVHLGEFLATWRESLRLFTDAAHRVRRDVLLFQRLYKSDWKRMKFAGSILKCHDCARNASAAWLELNYGWTPFLSDVYNSLFHLQRGLKKGLLANAKGRAVDYSEESLDPRQVTILTPGGVEILVDQTVSTKSTVNVSLWYKCKLPQLAELSTLGLIDPLEIVWEVTRYSFIVDWFLPIGPWLSSLTGDVGWDFLSGTCSRKREASVKVDRAYPSNDFWKGKVDVSFANSNINLFERTLYHGTPVPGLYLKNPLSVRHALNALALLVLAFKR